MRYYIIAGEKSGDMYGGQLIQELKNNDPKAIVRGIGGKYIEEAGAELLVSYYQIAVMGLQFLATFRKIYHYFCACKKDIGRFQPDVIILIDYGGFNLRIAKFAKKNSFKVFYYIPPKVWAWEKQRVYSIRSYVDHIFSILPFEKEFYLHYGYNNVSYIGHPLVDRVAAYHTQLHKAALLLPSFNKRFTIALLPGSRVQEVARIFPYMVALAKAMPHCHFFVAALRELPASLYAEALGIQHITLVEDSMYDVLSRAHVAVVTAGTASLEALLFNIPQVVVYKTDYWTYQLAKCCVSISYISLVNILANYRVVEELIQQDLTPAGLLREVEALVPEGKKRDEQLAIYQTIRKQLGSGNITKKIAQHMVALLKK